MEPEPGEIATGQEVTVRGQRWTVLRTTAYADCTAVWLTGIERANAAVHRTVLLPFDTVEPRHHRAQVEPAGPRRWCRYVRRHLSQQQPFGGLDALIPAHIQRHPFQLEPALALHRHGHLRILVADAVGLGKTIQAAAVLAQLTSDDPGVRSLIVCPAGLRFQWRTELADRFRLDASVCDPEWLASASRDLPPGLNPWSLPGLFITSVDLIKRPEVLRDLEDLTWDLAVFDEAHGLAPGTARLAAARVVADRSRRVLMLTATPPDGNPDHLAALTSLGQRAPADPVLVFRRTRADAGPGTERRSAVLAVRLSSDEAAMHRLLEAYTAAVWREASGREDSSTRLLSILLRKRALSSAGSLATSVARRLALLGNPREPAVPTQILLPLCDDEIQDDAPPDSIIGVPGLKDVAGERQLLEAVHAAAAAAAAAESKIRVLLRFLRRARQPAIVFTEYRDTLARLAAAMNAEPLQLHGGMLPQEREAVQARFTRDGGVLLATDAASEGLNLHQRCRLVVHFELPWNPMRLEQRIGRVDRLGQQRRVHELLVVARHTAERLVLVPLVRRVRAAQAARAGDALERLSESDVAAAILGDVPLASREPPPAPPTASFRPEAQAEARRLGLARAAGMSGRQRPREPILFWRRHPSPAVTVITRVTGETSAGRQLAAMVVPLVIANPHDQLLSPGDAEAFLARCGPVIAAGMNGYLSNGSPWSRWAVVVAALVRREEEIRSLVTTASVHPVQAGLFDRRAQADADARRQAASAWQERADARLAALAHEAAVRTRVEVIAICTGRLDGR